MGTTLGWTDLDDRLLSNVRLGVERLQKTAGGNLTIEGRTKTICLRSSTRCKSEVLHGKLRYSVQL